MNVVKNKQVLASVMAISLGLTVNQQAHSANDIEIVSGSVQTNLTEIGGGSSWLITTDDTAQLGVDHFLNYWDDTSNPWYFTLTTGANGTNTQQGNITFSEPLDFNTSGGGSSGGIPLGHVTLNLDAHNDIILSSVTDSDLLTDNHLTLYLTPDSDATGGGSVILNGSIEGNVYTVINGDLVIGATGSYSLDNYLSADSIDNSAGGTFNFNAGTLVVNNAGLTVGAGGLLSSLTLDGTKTLELANNNVLTIDATGSVDLSGGTLTAGSISNAGSFSFTSGSLTLTNSSLTVGVGGLLGSNITLGSTENLSVSGGVTIDATGTMSLDGGNYSFANIDNSAGGSFSFTSGSLTLTNSGLTVGTGGLLGSSLILDGTRSLSVSNGVTIDATGTMTLDGGSYSFASIDNSAGGNFSFNSGFLSLTNSGATIGTTGLFGNDVTLNAEHRLSVSGDLTVNSAASVLVNGGDGSSPSNTYQFVGGTLINNGTVNMTHGSIHAGSVINDGAAASITLNGTGNSYDWNYATDSYLRTGAITNTNGANMTLDGGILQAASISNTNGGSFTFNSGLLSLDNLTIGNGQALGNDFTLDFTKFLWIADSGAGVLTIDAGASFTLDGGRMVVDSISNAGSFIFNSGTVQVDGAGITIGNGGEFGNVWSLGNNSTLNFHSAYNNSQVFTVDAGASFSLDGGSLLLDSQTTLNVAGDFNFNSGYLNLAGNALTVGNGGLLGDQVILSAGKSLGLDAALTIDAAAGLTLNGGSLYADAGIVNNGNFSFNSGYLSMGGGLTVGATGLLGDNVALSSNRRFNVGNVTIEAGARLSVTNDGLYTSSVNGMTNSGVVNVTGGKLYTDGDITNDNVVNVAAGAALGDFSVLNGSSGYYSNNVHTYTQNSGRTTINGTLAVASVVVNGGRLGGAGVIDGDVTVLGGTLGPGNSPGTLEITGDFVLTPAGTLHMEVGSDGGTGYLWDKLIVGGAYDIQLDSMIQFSLLDGKTITDLTTDFAMTDFFYSGTAGSETPIDALTLAFFGNANIYTYDPLLTQWYSMTFDGVTGAFTGALEVAAVPVPAAVWLFSSGLLGLIGVARRRAIAA